MKFIVLKPNGSASSLVLLVSVLHQDCRVLVMGYESLCWWIRIWKGQCIRGRCENLVLDFVRAMFWKGGCSCLQLLPLDVFNWETLEAVKNVTFNDIILSKKWAWVLIWVCHFGMFSGYWLFHLIFLFTLKSNHGLINQIYSAETKW